MMMFHETAEKWIRGIAKSDKENYQLYRDMNACKEVFPFMQKMSISSRHKILSIDSKWGKEGFGEEYCYYIICETLEAHLLEYYLELLERLAAQDVRCEDPGHEYTFISLVIITSGFSDRKMIRRIKHFRGMRFYQEEEKKYGWSVSRICVVNLETMRLYWSVMGEPLGKRLTGGNKNGI